MSQVLAKQKQIMNTADATNSTGVTKQMLVPIPLHLQDNVYLSSGWASSKLVVRREVGRQWNHPATL
jgi:hypothetical protein